MKCFRCDNWPCTCPDGITILHGDCAAIITAAIDAATQDLRSWSGLLSILDALHPENIPALSWPDAGPGPHLVWALREIERLKEQVAELQDISFDRAEDCAEARECELCGRGVDGKPHIICGECQSEYSQPRKQEPE